MSQDSLYQFDEEFRDAIGTVDETGKRIWLHPKKPKGYYHNLRVVVTILLLGVLFTGPFLTIGGRPFLLLNVFERKFVILGQAFWPQDFFLLALLGITLFVFVILFTVVFGRIWCGWACPQTLFMEMVFRKIEYWIEGDANQQRKLAKAPWNFEKIRKKTLKFSIYAVFSFLISHTVMSYLIGFDQVVEIASRPPTENMAGFTGMLFFTGLFFWVFSYLREQACVAICPYGRLQGVLLDNKSIAVMYDWLRGEPRGRINKKQAEPSDKGDCIDCKLCVHACPTGIDIRNGTQLECVNCTACIDACDEVMEKVNKPKGLIKYASYDSIKTGAKTLFSTRVKAYSVVLLLLMVVLSTAIMTRSDIETTILKVPGQLYQQTEEGTIKNLYNIQFVNKTFDDLVIELKVLDEPMATISKVGGGDQNLVSNSLSEGVYFIEIPKSNLQSARVKVKVGVYVKGELIETATTKFIGPIGTIKVN